jgi:polysaccharide biosynthesis/export protein
MKAAQCVQRRHREFVLLLALGTAFGQSAPAPADPARARRDSSLRTDTASAGRYVLGPGDQITVWALGVEELGEQPQRIDPLGNIDLPLIGQVRAGGLTVEELKTELANRLRKQVREPRISINIVEYHSQPVSVLGAVNSPGLQQLQGEKTLAEVLSMAGGIRPDAGYSIRITRQKEWGAIPLPGAKEDASGRYTVAEAKLKSLLEAEDPAVNVTVRPNDVITVPRAQMVYVIGEVTKAGGFALNERENVSVLQALSLAGGLTRTAKGSDCRILRGGSDATNRTEIPVNVQRILERKAGDVALQSDDVLFIPSSAAKRGAVRALEAAINIGTGIVIWRH